MEMGGERKGVIELPDKLRARSTYLAHKTPVTVLREASPGDVGKVRVKDPRGQEFSVDQKFVRMLD